MFKLSDRVKETTLTQGTGTLTLAGSFGSFQSFLDGIGEDNSTFYTIENNSQFEIGIGTFSSNTLSRDTILSSSNSNNKINLAGMSLVFCTYPASKSVFLEDGFIKSLSPQYSGIMFPDQTVLTSASGVLGNVSLPSGLVYTSGATFTGLISSPSGNFTSLTVSGIPLLNGGYDYEIHVSQIDGNDTTGNGDLLNPVASITKALTLVGSQRKTIIVHPGTYTENPSITVQYTTITGPGLIGGNIVLSGTLSTNTGCTIAGIKMTNLIIATPTGAGNVNILNCEISGTLTKSSNADYTVLRLCDYGAASITGAGLVAIFGGNPNFTTVNNAGANVIIKSAVTVAPVLTSGTLSLVDSVVVAAVTNAITSAASSVITLANCQMLTSALSNVAPIVLNGFYSIINCVYNKPSSTLATLSATGGSTNSIDYFQYINADKFITQGGTSSQYVKGDGSLALFPDNIVYTSGNQTISGVKTFSDLPFVNGTGVSISGHTHTSSNITNFNSSVSGLLPVTNIVAGSNITVSPVSGTYTINSLDTRWNLFLPPPTNFVIATPGVSQATISWAAPANKLDLSPTDYIIQYKAGAGDWVNVIRNQSTNRIAVINDLDNGVSYVFRVATVSQIGTGEYSSESNAVTPTEAAAPDLLLMHFDGAGDVFVDSSSSPRTIQTFGSVTQSSVQSKFGGKSGLFSGGYLTATGMEFGVSDFVVEAFIKTTTTTQYATLISVANGYFYPGAWTILLNATQTGSVSVYVADHSTVASLLHTSESSVCDGAWHHIAFVRNIELVSLYIDGVMVDSNAFSTSFSITGSAIAFGTDTVFNGREFIGNIDELRILSGANGGYSGATINIPVSAFSA